jgi:galactitol-specific phosphotransferase system IIC component
MTDPLDEKINRRNSNTARLRRRVGFWFSLVAFGFLLGILAGHLLFHH